MRKLLTTFSILIFSSVVLMANLSSEYSADLSTLKAQYPGMDAGKTEKEKKVETQKKMIVAQNRNVRIAKVTKFSDITNYSLSHKKLTSITRKTAITKADIIVLANSVHATTVLVYIHNNIRYIYFYQN